MQFRRYESRTSSQPLCFCVHFLLTARLHAQQKQPANAELRKELILSVLKPEIEKIYALYDFCVGVLGRFADNFIAVYSRMCLVVCPLPCHPHREIWGNEKASHTRHNSHPVPSHPSPTHCGIGLEYVSHIKAGCFAMHLLTLNVCLCTNA